MIAIHRKESVNNRRRTQGSYL